MTYALPRKAFNTLAELLGKDKAEVFASELEESIESSKIEIKVSLKDELATKEDLHKEIRLLEGKIDLIRKENKIIIALVIIFGSIVNPNFIELIKTIFIH